MKNFSSVETVQCCKKNCRNILYTSSLVMIAVFAGLANSKAEAYGKANWQAAFSTNCNDKSICTTYDPITQQVVPATFGTWGWCAFTGINSGTEADCVYSGYGFSDDPNVSGLATTQVNGTAWSLKPSTFPTSNGPQDFFITDGTVTFNGPTISALIKTGFDFSLIGCTVNGSTVTCPVQTAQLFAPAFFEDQGYGPYPGHFTLHLGPGINENVQITQIK